MQRLMWKMLVLVFVVGLSQFSIGKPVPDQASRDMASMSLAELEKAGDEARAQKDYDQAIQYFEAALRRDKKNAVLLNKLGLSELKNGDNKSARTHFEKAIKANKKYADAFNNVGAVYFVEKNLNQATRYFKQAIALEEGRANFHINLGEAWFAQKRWDWAMNEFSRALELDPEVLAKTARVGISAQVSSPEERAKFYYLLAKVQAKRGDVQECLLCLRKAKENGYHDIRDVYRDEEFRPLWTDARLAEIVPPTAPQ